MSFTGHDQPLDRQGVHWAAADMPPISGRLAHFWKKYFLYSFLVIGPRLLS